MKCFALVCACVPGYVHNCVRVWTFPLDGAEPEAMLFLLREVLPLGMNDTSLCVA